jgi:predicted metal-dependent peptidase
VGPPSPEESGNCERRPEDPDEVERQPHELPREPIDHTRLAAARLRAVGLQPFLAVALYALTPVADYERETFAVDERWRLYVNPRRLREWTVPEVAGVLLHEVGHVVRDHAGRSRTATGYQHPDELAALRWNVAADAEINDDLVDAGVTLPEKPVTPGSLGMPPHMVAEYYYAKLVESDAEPAEELDCGSGCHGRRDAAESAPLIAAGLLVPAGLSDVEAMLLRRRIAESIARRASQQPGTVGGGWLRWAQATLHPQLDWRKLLRAKIRSSAAAVAGSVDYSYARPPRRRVPRVVLPAMRAPLPRVAVVVDTSGSVSDQALAMAWTEVHACLRAMGVRRDLAAVYAADADVHRLTGAIGKQIQLTGGGGTDMASAIEFALRARPRPDLVVVITDGITPWPATRPGRDVIVALLPQPPGWRWGRPAPPSWAQIVEISDTNR